MPRYEYACKTPKCKGVYEIFMTVNEFEKAEQPKCPKCGAILQQSFGASFRWNTSGGTRGRIL